MVSPMASLHLTLDDLERLKLKAPSFQSFVSHKGAELGHTLHKHEDLRESTSNQKSRKCY